jgi:hypothetical protein
MAAKVNWTHRAWKTYEANIDWLQLHWTKKEIAAFVLLTDKKIALLSTPAYRKSTQPAQCQRQVYISA